MAPTAWDKAFFEKNLIGVCKAFSKAATVPSPALAQKRNSRERHAPQSSSLPGLEEFNKALSLLKALLTESPQVISKALSLVAKEQLLPTALIWIDRVLPITMVELAAGHAGSHAPPLPPQNNISQALTYMQRLFRILAAMLKLYSTPAQLHTEGSAALFAGTALDVLPLDRVLSRVLHPILMEAEGRQRVHSQYRQAVLGSALNMVHALISLALRPALHGSTLTTCILESMCTTDLIPSMAGLLAHATPTLGPGQSQEKWYESVTGGLIDVLSRSKSGPASISSTFMRGWQKAVLAPMVQELLLERLVHGLRDASPSGLECPPGFDGFGLLPGQCCEDESQLMGCMQLCLDAQWLAWRAARAGEAPSENVLEPGQLFELTRQVAEQGIMVVAEDIEQCMEEEGQEEGAPRPALVLGQPGLAALSACAACLSDLQWLWPGLQPAQHHQQLPLVLALAANTLAFASQGLDACEELGVSGSGQGGGAGGWGGQAGRGAVKPDQGQRAFGRGMGGAIGNHLSVDGEGQMIQDGVFGIKAQMSSMALLQDCSSRAIALLSFFFPVHREGAVLLGQLSSLYSPQAWGAMSEQASGALGALEMALRSEKAAPTPAIHIMLLHALAGAMQAAPGSYWTHHQGRDRTGLMSTLRKVANKAAEALEENIADAQLLEKQILAPPPQQALGEAPLATAQAASVSSNMAAHASRAAADAIDRTLQQRVDFMHRLLMLVVDGNGLLTAPSPATDKAPPPTDPDFTGLSSPSWAGQVQTSFQGRPCGTPPDWPQVPGSTSPSVVVVIQPHGSGAVGQTAPLLGPQGRKGLGNYNPDALTPSAPVQKRVSEAQLHLRAWILAELLPAWLRLWTAQLAALALGVQAEALSQVVATFQAARGPRQPGHQDTTQAPNAPQSNNAETARYQLMRSGMEWLTRVVSSLSPLCQSILQAHSQHVSPAGVPGRTGLDHALLAVAKATRQVVSVITASDLLVHLNMQVQLEKRRLNAMGVPEGQAGTLRTLAALLAALANLPGSGKTTLARGVLEHGLAASLAALYDEQRRLGGRVGAAAATMDALQVLSGAVEDALSTRQPGGGNGRPEAVAQVVQARKMLSQLSTAPPPTSTSLSTSGDVYTDDGFEAQAAALVEVVMDESLETLRFISGPAPAMDSVLASMALHMGCCNPQCTNLEEEGEHLLQLHMCQGCMRVRYCSRACQVSSWVAHQEQCKHWSAKGVPQ